MPDLDYQAIATRAATIGKDIADLFDVIATLRAELTKPIGDALVDSAVERVEEFMRRHVLVHGIDHDVIETATLEPHDDAVPLRRSDVLAVVARLGQVQAELDVLRDQVAGRDEAVERVGEVTR
jgi:hypothetical protein